MWKPVVCVTALAAAMICTEVLGQTAAPKDGELPLPDYKSWDVFLKDVQKPDTKQIRDIYINAKGAAAESGPALPNGSVLVMEIHKAKVGADGNAVTGADGQMQRDGLSKIFVMGKNDGWGKGLEPANGAWVYSAFEPDGKLAEVDYATCRACHLPMTDADFVPRLAEYFSAR